MFFRSVNLQVTDHMMIMFCRHSRLDDLDSRSESSLSWGDDEFEGEATRQVGALFDQLDSLLYKEENPLSPFPYSLLTNNSSNSPVFTKTFDHSQKVDGDFNEELSSEKVLPDLSRYTCGSESSMNSSDQLLDVDESFDTFYDSGRLITSNSHASNPPSLELQEECSDWVHQFPHFR